ncbi:hypothetical protein BC941DRAFT_413355 [Chlamydoabsidia padenii]|nr:hypothetical protein BC941DRAFT_413355 [Chlamydoabsidia padenii]
MFIFSPGFEAATLKVPSKDGEEDPTVPAVSNSGHNNNKKQIIGFAKFRSRTEALNAKDTISGRKVDAEKGSVLKAEMAKKNLHTKRGLSSNDPFHPPATVSLPSHDLLQQPAYHQQEDHINNKLSHNNGPHHSSVYEAFHSVPASDPTLVSDIYSDLFIPRNTVATATAPTTTTIPGTHRPTINTTKAATRMSDLFSPTSHRFSSGNIFDLTQLSSENDMQPPSSLPKSGLLDNQEQRYTSFPTSETILSPSSSSSISQALQHQYQQYHHQQHYQQKHLHSSPPPFLDDDPSMGFNGLTINTNPTTTTTTTTTSLTSTPTSTNLPSPGLLSPNGYRSFATMMMSTNPADQNPPCNTLYVGNLPPNTDEEELRSLFTKCLGYKRLSFRQKPNGPMCFVEFEDVYCATQALQDLYGNPLSNSVKGGIRLSFSKNPLGVRQNTGCNQTTGLFHPVLYYRDNLSFDPPYS